MRDGYTDQPIQVPCGKCVGCLAKRARDWSVRMVHEASMHERNCFVTLTYRDPCPERISRRDVQLFIKRLRNHSKFRYFACGEYGSKTRRPHYHAIIFGEDYLGGSSAVTDDTYLSPIITAAWGLGHALLGRCTVGSMKYVAGYAVKKIGDPDTFNLMSRRPGIGHSWLDKYRSDCVNDNVVIDGSEYKVPSRYIEWAELDEIRESRKAYVSSLTPDQICDRRESLRAVERNKLAVVQMKKELM